MLVLSARLLFPILLSLSTNVLDWNSHRYFERRLAELLLQVQSTFHASSIRKRELWGLFIAYRTSVFQAPYGNLGPKAG